MQETHTSICVEEPRETEERAAGWPPFDSDINKDMNIFLLFPDQATPFTFKNNFRIILGSKPEKFE